MTEEPGASMSHAMGMTSPDGRKRSAFTPVDWAKRMKFSAGEDNFGNENMRYMNQDAAQKAELSENDANRLPNEEVHNQKSDSNVNEEFVKREIKLEVVDDDEFNSAPPSFPSSSIDPMNFGESDTNQTQCKICNKPIKFQVKGKLYDHYISHFEGRLMQFCTGIDNEPGCSICGKKFTRRRALLAHIGLVHKILDSLLPDDMKYENLINPYNRKVTNNEKFSPIISKLINVLGWPKDKVLLLKGKLLCESLKEFTVCHHCHKLVIGQRGDIERHIIQYYYDDILRYPNIEKCNLCREDQRCRSDLARHLAIGHRIIDKVVPREELMFTKISKCLQEDYKMPSISKQPEDGHTPESKERKSDHQENVNSEKPEKKAEMPGGKNDMSQYLHVDLQESELKGNEQTENRIQESRSGNFDHGMPSTSHDQFDAESALATYWRHTFGDTSLGGNGGVPSSETDLTNSEMSQSKSELEKNEVNAGGKGGKFLSCQLCRVIIKFTARKEVYRHYSIHFKERLLDINRGHPTTCCICDKSFARTQQLCRHIGVSHNEVENMLPESMKYDYIMRNELFHTEMSDLMHSESLKTDNKVLPIEYFDFAKISAFAHGVVNQEGLFKKRGRPKGTKVKEAAVFKKRGRPKGSKTKGQNENVDRKLRVKVRKDKAKVKACPEESTVNFELPDIKQEINEDANDQQMEEFDILQRNELFADYLRFYASGGHLKGPKVNKKKKSSYENRKEFPEAENDDSVNEDQKDFVNDDDTVPPTADENEENGYHGEDQNDDHDAENESADEKDRDNDDYDNHNAEYDNGSEDVNGVANVNEYNEDRYDDDDGISHNHSGDQAREDLENNDLQDVTVEPDVYLPENDYSDDKHQSHHPDHREESHEVDHSSYYSSPAAHSLQYHPKFWRTTDEQ